MGDQFWVLALLSISILILQFHLIHPDKLLNLSVNKPFCLDRQFSFNKIVYAMAKEKVYYILFFVMSSEIRMANSFFLNILCHQYHCNRDNYCILPILSTLCDLC